MADGWLQRLGIAHPIIQAPMAGGHSTAALVAAVSNAGGLGSQGCAYMTPEQIVQEIRQIRALTDRPFNINLFAGGYQQTSAVDPAPMLALLAELHAGLGLPPPALAPVPPDPFPAQLEAVLAARPPVFSFTFGIPPAAAMARLKAAGIAVLGTATTVEEARRLQAAGVDAVVAQGEEAGAHRGSFLAPFEQSMIPAVTLVRAVLSVLSVPAIASGALMNGRDIAGMLRLGASAVQIGTAFMTTPEAGTPPAHKQAMLAARDDTTVITRVFSGRPARGLANAFIARLQGRDEIVPPFPLQNNLTRAMRGEAAKQGETGLLSLWAGRGVTQARAMPAAELVRTLVAEIARA
jgi:nitronate monooxygenase